MLTQGQELSPFHFTGIIGGPLVAVYQHSDQSGDSYHQICSKFCLHQPKTTETSGGNNQFGSAVGGTYSSKVVVYAVQDQFRGTL
jgi:hypothetical protein